MWSDDLMPASGQGYARHVLTEYDPGMQAEGLELAGKMKDVFIFHVRDAWSNEYIDGEPVWWPAFVRGWVDISHLIPDFLKKAYKNQITWKWHVQIPYSYWDKKFPLHEFAGPDERKKAINMYMDRSEMNLCGVENAEKPLFSTHAVNEINGKIEEEWKEVNRYELYIWEHQSLRFSLCRDYLRQE